MPLADVLAFIAGAKVRVRLTSEPGDRYPYGFILDKSGKVIGTADSYVYRGSAFAVHTSDFAGWTPFEQIEFVETAEVK